MNTRASIHLSNCRYLQRSAAAQQALTAAAAAALAASAAAGDRDREDHEPRTASAAPAAFDFRHLIPQVTLKTDMV